MNNALSIPAEALAVINYYEVGKIYKTLKLDEIPSHVMQGPYFGAWSFADKDEEQFLISKIVGNCSSSCMHCCAKEYCRKEFITGVGKCSPGEFCGFQILPIGTGDQSTSWTTGNNWVTSPSKVITADPNAIGVTPGLKAVVVSATNTTQWTGTMPDSITIDQVTAFFPKYKRIDIDPVKTPLPIFIFTAQITYTTTSTYNT